MRGAVQTSRLLAQEALARCSWTPPTPGSGGETVEFVRFSFDTPSPLVLQAVAVGQIFNRAALRIVVPFDDPNATLALGTTANPTLIFGPGEVDLASVSQFENRFLDAFTSRDFLILTLSPGASTTGSGILLYKLR